MYLVNIVVLLSIMLFVAEAQVIRRRGLRRVGTEDLVQISSNDMNLNKRKLGKSGGKGDTPCGGKGGGKGDCHTAGDETTNDEESSGTENYSSPDPTNEPTGLPSYDPTNEPTTVSPTMAPMEQPVFEPTIHPSKDVSNDFGDRGFFDLGLYMPTNTTDTTP